PPSGPRSPTWVGGPSAAARKRWPRGRSAVPWLNRTVSSAFILGGLQPAHGKRKKSRRGGTPEGVRPRRLTRQQAPRSVRVALHLVIRRPGLKIRAEPTSNRLQLRLVPYCTLGSGYCKCIFLPHLVSCLLDRLW